MKVSSKRITLIRHAQSVMNKMFIDVCDELNLLASDYQLIFYAYYKLDRNLLDPGLSPHGFNQTIKARESESEKVSKIKMICTTATRRTLQTARGIFNTQERKDLKLVVLPFFERAESIGDIFSDTELLIGEFPEFDFSLVKREIDKYGWLWFAQHFTNNYKRDGLIKYVEEHWKDFPEEEERVAKGFAMTKYMRTYAPEIFESWADLSVRVSNHRNTLKRFLLKEENLGYGDDEIAFVAHHSFFKIFTAKSFNEKNEPLEYWDAENCEMKPYDLDLFANL